jgi:inner membrane protein
VNVYALAHRATEYGFLFVLFTFAGLALAEVLAGVRLHAIQYALVGSALAVFFLLLIALAEHASFAIAYFAAASACVALLTAYLRHPLGTRGRTGAFFALFVLMYGTLYALLLSEDHALLTGSLLVFGVLAIAMLATRQLDWAALAARLGARGAAAKPAPEGA